MKRNLDNAKRDERAKRKSSSTLGNRSKKQKSSASQQNKTGNAAGNEAEVSLPNSAKSTVLRPDEHSESSASQESVHTSKSPSSGPATPMVAAIGGISKPHIIAKLNRKTEEVFFIIMSDGRSATSVSERDSGESGYGDHVTPNSAFLRIACSAVEDADPKDIPGRIEQMAKIFLKDGYDDSVTSASADLCQDFEKKLSKMRAKRKTTSQRIRRMELSKPEGEGGYKGTISSDKVRKHCQVEESMNFIADNYHELCDPLKREEKLFIGEFVAERAQEFIANLNLEEDVSFSKGRVKAKRAAKEGDLRKKIEHYQIDGRSVTGSIEDKIKAVKAHIISKRTEDRTADEVVTLKDIAYHNRIRGEGARVSMALKGLRALNELIRVKNELEAIDEDASLPEDVKCEQKKELVDYLRLNKDIESGGLRGTELNPTFGIEDINSITNRDGTGLNISSDQLKELSHKAGYLFARLFDYEMVEYESGDLAEDQRRLEGDLEMLYRLSARHLSFMCCAFRHLTTISSENRLEAVKSFSSAVLEEQDWGKVVMESGEVLDENTLVDKIKSNINRNLYSLFPNLQASSGQCTVM